MKRGRSDADTLFVALNRGTQYVQWAAWLTRDQDLALMAEAGAALARIRESLANSVPVEQAKMEGME